MCVTDVEKGKGRKGRGEREGRGKWMCVVHLLMSLVVVWLNRRRGGRTG
jgi:hypothetical protein